MKWDKVLTYLMVMFVCVNVILGMANYNKNVRAYKLSETRIENITSILRKHNIALRTKLPTTFKPIASVLMLPVEITPTIRDQLTKNLLTDSKERLTITEEASGVPYEKATRVYRQGEKELKFRPNYIYYKDYSIQKGQGFVTENKAKKIAEAFLKLLDIPESGKKIKMEYISESYGASMTYYEVYDNLPIFGSYVHMKLTEEGVFEMVMHKNRIENVASSRKPIYAIDEVLFGLLDDLELGKSMVIDNIVLGYAISDSIEMHVLREEAVPMYKINIQGLDEPIFVNAYTNTVEELGTGSFFK